MLHNEANVLNEIDTSNYTPNQISTTEVIFKVLVSKIAFS